MKIYYWSPHLSKVGTIKSVYNSCKSLRNKGIDAKIINAIGEWSHIDDEIRIDLLKKNNFYDKLSRKGYFKSRFVSTLIFFVAFFPLLRLLKKDQPDYLIIHLITSLPLILKNFFSLKTSVILRISGKINFSLFRRFLWKKVSKNIIVTSPTEETKKKLIDKKIFPENRINLVKDPILENFEKIDKLKINVSRRKKFLAVGRLTKQKNFIFLVNSFSIVMNEYKDISLTIIGDSAEEKIKLEKLINEKNLKDRIFLLGYKKNIDNLYKDFDCFVLSSLHEEPGFVLIEAASNFLPIISSNCPSGPKEILGYGNNGLLYRTNDQNDFLSKLVEYFEMSDKVLKEKLFNLNQKIQEYTFENHSKELQKIFKKNKV